MSATCTAVGRRWFGMALPALVGLLAVAIGCGDGDDMSNPTRGGSVPSPTIEGPITGGKGMPFIASTTFDLAEVGYSEAEYFISGTATAYANVGPLGTDGNWTVRRGDTAAYKTRILVYRPIEPKKFNGTVVVEWLNVSGGLDSAADWIADHTELIRDGFAWVGVSAQRVGVEGGPAVIPGLPPIPLKTTDPERYGSLVHPGDSFSYDMFSQAAQAIRRPAGSSPLGDLKVSTVIATGDSQSAFRLVTYINAIHPLADIYDGFLVHSRGGNSYSIAPLSEAPQPAITVPATAQIRNDLDVPVLTFETETDLTFLGYFSARQPDTDRFRLWEVAGTAHADTYTLGVGTTDRGDSPDAAKLVVTTMPVPAFPALKCRTPINSGPQHFVLNAAIAALNQWVRHGTPPPLAPRLEVVDGASIAIVHDANGNALGGIRTPQVDVPIAALSGQGQTGSILCVLFGTTKPFDATTLAALYPDHSAYVSAFNAATDRAVSAGFILQPDAELMKAAAAS
ncbi:MAG TPA: alpha/beta hydrolase domain-containing protein [Candidatus Binatia bacterium]